MIPKPNKKWQELTLKAFRKFGIHGSSIFSGNINNFNFTLKQELPAILITGATGTGKSVLALDVAKQALEQGLSVNWYSYKPVNLSDEVRQCLEDITLSLEKTIDLNKCNLAERMARSYRINYSQQFHEFRFDEEQGLLLPDRDKLADMLIIDDMFGPELHQKSVIKLLESGKIIILIAQTLDDFSNTFIKQTIDKTDMVIFGKSVMGKAYPLIIQNFARELEYRFDAFSEFGCIKRDERSIIKLRTPIPTVNDMRKPKMVVNN